MTQTKRILKVPEETVLRNILRDGAYELVKNSDLRPPGSFVVLENLAQHLIKTLNVSTDFIDFAIVLIGNELWRNTVKATPMHRRLLLLPQCLKNNASCQGVFDALGLVCAGCKSCVIDDVLVEAENLGYTTLVAEGTTVAVGLVEEGAIDAVIGVSCMPVLQRSFEKVSNAAVPVIGLPLMYDGCTNTKIDFDWLLQEIRMLEEDDTNRPISISLLKAEIQNYFTSETIQAYFSEIGVAEDLAKGFMLNGGQRLRPLLAVMSYRAYTHSDEEFIARSLAFIIESFHKASLIHDDIQDNSERRYGEDTFHLKHGIPLAINAGDYLMGKGYQLLSTLPVNAEMLVNCLKRVSNSHVKLTQGQGADILLYSNMSEISVEHVLHIFRLKTGEAIKVPLTLGAILGNADGEEVIVLAEFADVFGIAYQIRDDINEFTACNADEKLQDFPLLLALLVQTKEIDFFKAVNVDELIGFRALFVEYDVLSKAELLLHSYVEQCYATLDKLKNSKLRLSLYAVVGKTFKVLSTYE